MNTSYKRILSGLAAVVTVWIFTVSATHAALIPTYVPALTNGNTQVQVTVFGADPNAQVTLYYPTNGSYAQLNVGLTNGSGTLSYTVNPAAYNMTAGGLSYVIVNGSQSQTQVWPSYTAQSVSNTSGSLSLSQNNVTLVVGQSTVISVSGGNGSLGTVSVPSNINQAVAAATVANTQITVSGYSSGSTSMTVCASSVGCTTLYVTVQQPSSTSNQTSTQSSSVISFSQSSVSLQAGQSQTVTLYGPGSYYISNNSNPNVISTSLSGSSLFLTAVNAGTTVLGVCGSGNNTSSCSNLSVTVTGTVTNTPVSQQTITFSQDNVSLIPGETRTVTVSGPGLGSYYISASSDAMAVMPTISGNTITLIGGSNFGGSNMTVCQLGGACGNLYAFVSQNSNTGSAASTVTATNNQPLSLASFGISSNNVGGGFMTAGAALSFTVSANQAITPPTIVVGGQTIAVYGSGSGPYTGIYTLIGNESSPITVAVTVSNSAGVAVKSYFSLGNSPVTTSASTVSSALSTFNSGSAVFTRYLDVGSTGLEVTALQTRLTALGVYSGPITGTYGALTEAAVKKYQAKHGLSQVGVVGPATRALLNKGL